MKQAVSENVQKVDHLKGTQNWKASTTRWLTHGERSAPIIGRVKLVVTTFDARFTEK